MIKLSNPEPTLLPWIFRYLGPFKYVVFASQLTGYENPADPWLGGLSPQFQAPSALRDGAFDHASVQRQGGAEFQSSRIVQLLRGKIAPPTPTSWRPSIFGCSFRSCGMLNSIWNMAETTAAAGTRNIRRKLFSKTTPGCSGSTSRASPATAGPICGWNTPGTPTASIDTPGMWYGHSIYRSGYTHNDMIMGHHMGPDAEDLFTRVTYYLTNNFRSVWIMIGWCGARPELRRGKSQSVRRRRHREFVPQRCHANVPLRLRDRRQLQHAARQQSPEFSPGDGSEAAILEGV